MHEHNHTNGIYRTFTFTWPSQQNLVIGKIVYNPDTQQVLLENPGTINKFNLLLGGSGSSKQQNEFRNIFFIQILNIHLFIIFFLLAQS